MLNFVLEPLVGASGALIRAIVLLTMYETRVLSGMRPTGSLHLGHYHGVLKNWVRLQAEYPCLFFVADWHALTTDYDEPRRHPEEHLGHGDRLARRRRRPEPGDLFIQSQVPEHAELHLLLSMMTPLGWLERVPTYKDQQEKLADKDLSTYGFLGYPLLQSADILIYRAKYVPVGEDQVPHVEFTREVARRFNHLYGREPGFEDKAKAAVKKMGSKKARLFNELRTKFLERATPRRSSARRRCSTSSRTCRAATASGCTAGSRAAARRSWSSPRRCSPRRRSMPGLDGQKMSKSYGNTIALREEPESVAKKIRTMPTDPARVKRTDPGNPEKCPVWDAAQDLLGRRAQEVGAEGLHHRRHRLPGVQAAGDRGDQRASSRRCASARRPTSTTRRW